MSELESYKRAYLREKNARKQAESILEQKSLELFDKNTELQNLNSTLEGLVQQRTQELNSKMEELKLLFDEHPSPMMVYSMENYSFLAVNNAALKSYGYSVDEFLSMKVSDLHESSELDILRNHLSRIKSGKNEVRVWEHLKKNGEKIIVEISAASIIYQGVAARLVAIKDISESYRANQKIKRSEEKYRSIIENLSLGLLEVDKEEKITKVYPKFCELTGYSEEELIGRVPSDFLIDLQV